jgi:multidrug resistance efflux pump
MNLLLRSRIAVLLISPLAICLAPPLSAQESKPAAKTHTIARGPLKVEVTLDGSLESVGAAEVSIDPDEPVGLAVKSAIPHGTRVTKGQTLIELDARKLSEQIRDQEADQALAELSLKQARQDLELLTKSAPLDGQLAERSQKIAAEDLTLFEQVERPFTEKSAAQQLKQAEQQFEYTQEELKQLEKMYKADDLTEETEEIILKRARNDVEQMRFFLESAKQRHEEQLKVQLPRSHDTHKHAADQAALVAEKSKVSLPMLIEKQKLQIEKIEFEQKKAAEQLARLKGDLAKMTITAPADGLAYYGSWQGGKWTGAAAMQQKLRPGGQIAPHEVVMTVVDPSRLVVRATLAEKDLGQVNVGAAGQMTAKARPDSKLAVKVQSVSGAPIAEGQFAATLEIHGAPAELVPGMTCQVKIAAYYKADALLAPAKSVFTDEVDEEQKYVFVVTGEGKHERRNVTLGQTTDKWAEIASGLNAGDKILVEKPAE